MAVRGPLYTWAVLRWARAGVRGDSSTPNLSKNWVYPLRRCPQTLTQLGTCLGGHCSLHHGGFISGSGLGPRNLLLQQTLLSPVYLRSISLEARDPSILFTQSLTLESALSKSHKLGSCWVWGFLRGGGNPLPCRICRLVGCMDVNQTATEGKLKLQSA